jgi:hypothetical protein
VRTKEKEGSLAWGELELRPARELSLWRPVMYASALCAVFALTWVTSAQAADTHLFDPVLSLTGDASVSPTDEVPDPGLAHPAKRFDDPCGAAVDLHGDIYVSSGASASTGAEGRIDIFNSEGEYLTSFADSNMPCNLSVDSAGTLYVSQNAAPGFTHHVVRYAPNSFPPTSATVYSGPVLVAEQAEGTAVDPSNDHLYVATSFGTVAEYDSAANGSALISSTLGEGVLNDARDVAVCDKSQDLYVTGDSGNNSGNAGRVFILDGTTHNLKVELDGSKTPSGSFGFTFGREGIAVDQSNCDFYVGDVFAHHVVDQFDSEGNFLSQLKHGGLTYAEPFSDLAVDNSTGLNSGYVYVTSSFLASNSHLWAFKPRLIGPPICSGVAASKVTATEAILEAKINPHGLDTTYHFEYVTDPEYINAKFNNAVSVPLPDADIGEGGSNVAVEQAISGLMPGMGYHIRCVAVNDEGTVESDGEAFTTHEEAGAALPDGRAYELVTPSNTGGRIPTATAFGLNNGFYTALAAPDNDSLVFGTVGGSLPNDPAGGYYDGYRAVRTTDGWQTQIAGPSGAQAAKAYPGSVSPDHEYSFWYVEGKKGSLTSPPSQATYVRGPDGGFAPIGVGGEGTDLLAQGKWLTAGARHIVFTSRVKLEPKAPESGTEAIYDRNNSETSVASLLPGDVTPQSPAVYQGVSADGSSVVFKIDSTMYERRDGSTFEIAPPEASVFAGTSSTGERVFFLNEEGNIFACDVEAIGCGPAGSTPTQIGSGGESTVVNISADGSHVYFVSAQQLDESKKGVPGAENLYVWDGSIIRFVAVLDSLDVTGESIGSFSPVGGLGQWVTDVVAPQQGRFVGPANDPSRSTPDGSVLVFTSRADLTGYDSQGHSEIYRYSTVDESLACVSCNPTGFPADSDALLVNYHSTNDFVSLPPLNAIAGVPNVTSDGKTIFFQSDEALIEGDVDGVTDVYEWEADGSGDCSQPTGCVNLISSGQSATPNYLYAVRPNGRDVFFLTSDMLVSQDHDSTPSIYDARVNGGFPPEEEARPCQGEACKGPPTTVPTLASAASTVFEGPDNPAPHKHRKAKKKKSRAKQHGTQGKKHRHHKHGAKKYRGKASR